MASVLRTLCSRMDSRPRLSARRKPGKLSVISVWADDSPNIACSRNLGPRLLFLRFDHVEILVGRSRIEQHDLVFGAEEATGTQLLVGNEGCGSFRRSEYAFHAGPVSRGREDLLVGRSDRGALAFLEYLENQVIAISLGHAQAGGKGSGASPHFGSVLALF